MYKIILPTFLDIEASSLGSRSYPIQVAWNSGSGEIYVFLISPETVPGWTDWDFKSEKLHGISKEKLIKEGENPRSVCNNIIEQLAGKTVYTDNPEFDKFWMQELFKACRLDFPEIEFKDSNELFLEMLAKNNVLNKKAELETLKTKAKQISPPNHKAYSDVKYLLALYQLIIE
ncbi:MAG: hypothetical protein GXX85_05040 [Ignavibacteria bacterium]|nr:hypothetical protein [Ignavibacteria bacterium]